MIKAVIFDLDDTLIDEYHFAFSAFKEIAQTLAIEFELTNNQVFNALVDVYKQSKIQVFNRFYLTKNKEITQERLNRLIEIYRNHNPIEYKLDTLTQTTLVKLKHQGVLLGIITDGYQKNQRNKIKAAHLDNLFDHIIVTDEMGREFWKPHEIAYQKMKEAFNLSFEEMVYIGDNIQKDFIAPQKLNMMSIYYKRHHPLAVHNNAFETQNDMITVTSKKELFEKLYKLVQ